MAQASSMSPSKSAFVGGLFLFPFLILNTIFGNRIEPFVTWVRPQGNTTAFELFLLALSWILLAVGAFIAVKPVMIKDKKGKRRYYFLNIIVAVILLAVFVMVSGLWEEIYRCEVLKIPNCD